MNGSEQLIVLGLSAWFLGFLAAIPVGAVQLEIARRSLNGFVSSALMVVLGSVASDFLYGIIALFGIAPYLQDPFVVACFWGANACILMVLGISILRTHRTPVIADRHAAAILAKHHLALVTGFLLSATNPLMIFWWLVAVRVLKDAGLVGGVLVGERFVFLGGGACGLGGYLILLALVVHRVKHFVSEKAIQRTTFVFGLLLLGLALYFGIRFALAIL